MATQFFHDGQYHWMEKCYSCGIAHSIPDYLYRSAVDGAPNISIRCPNGHSWHYKSKKMIHEDEQVRLERDRLKQNEAYLKDQLLEKDGSIRDRDRQISAQKGQVTKIKNRVGNGVCPCCNRTFANLAAHMKTKHKEFKAA